MAEKKTITEAVGSLNRIELIAIQKHYGVDVLQDLDKNLRDCLYGVYWALEKRDNPELKQDDVDVKGMDELQEYFTKDSETDFDGETPAGKD